MKLYFIPLHLNPHPWRLSIDDYVYGDNDNDNEGSLVVEVIINSCLLKSSPMKSISIDDYVYDDNHDEGSLIVKVIFNSCLLKSSALKSKYQR